MKKLILLTLLCSTCFCKQKDVELLLDWWPNPDHVPLYVGIDEKIFEKFDINLKIIKSPDPTHPIEFLISKKANLAIYYMPQAIRAFSKYPNFKIVGVLIKEPLQGFLFKEEKNIKTIEDFKNKNVGTYPDGLIETFLKTAADGINFKIKKLQFDLTTSIFTNAVDIVAGAFCNVEPFQLKSLNINTNFIKIKDLGLPNYYELVFLSNTDFLDKNPKFSENFKKAINESIQFCKKNPDKAFKIYLKNNPDKFSKTISWEKKAWELTKDLLADSQDIDKEMTKELYEWMNKKALIHKEFCIDKLFD